MIAETAVPPPGDQAAAPNPAENVERIREILFGSRMREYAQQFLQFGKRPALGRLGRGPCLQPLSVASS